MSTISFTVSLSDRDYYYTVAVSSRFGTYTAKAASLRETLQMANQAMVGALLSGRLDGEQRRCVNCERPTRNNLRWCSEGCMDEIGTYGGSV